MALRGGTNVRVLVAEVAGNGVWLVDAARPAYLPVER